MLVCQGEGLELDAQRRRHPIWEWLLSHPVRPAAVIVAEGFTPFATNPLLQTAPVFFLSLFSKVNDGGGVLVIAIVAGIAIAVAASILNKTIEAAAMLRVSVRNRGAILGIISWLGFIGMMLPLLLFSAPQAIYWAIRKL
jgi:hypothetical protein